MRGLKLWLVGVVSAIALWALFAMLGGPLPATAQAEPMAQRSAVSAAAQWLIERHQNEDGGFTAFSQGAGEAPSDVAGTVDAMLALASAGYNVAAPYAGRQSAPLDFLRASPGDLASYAGQSGAAAGKLILALSAGGENPRTFAGYDLTISLTQHLSPSGQYGIVSAYEQALAIMAQTVVSDTTPPAAVEWLLSAQEQQGDFAGSWDDGFGTEGNIDATAMAVMALAATQDGDVDEALATARNFLLESQLDDGGWGYAPGLPRSANSTALAIQALSALDEDYASAQSAWSSADGSPLETLLGWQSASGAFQADFGAGPADDFFTTVQALPAVSGRPYPLPAPYEAVRHALSCLQTMRDAENRGWPEFAGAGPSAGGTARALRALVMAGEDVDGAAWAVDDLTPLELLRDLTPAYIESGRGGRLGVIMRSADMAGADVTSFGGIDLELQMGGYLSPTGEYDDTSFGPYSHALAILGLLSAGLQPDGLAMSWLLEAQAEDGGWGDVDATAASVQALALAADSAYQEAIAGGLQSLRQSQLADGGWGFDLPASVNSTSEVAQALVAAGENPFGPAWSVAADGRLRNGQDVALAQQGSNGCWPNLFGEGDDPYATTDGIILLSLQPPNGPFAAEAGEADGAGVDAAEAPATAEATATPDIIISATEFVASPTAEPGPLDDEIISAEGDDDGHSAATPATNVETTADDPGGLIWWIVSGVVLLLLAMLYFRKSSNN